MEILLLLIRLFLAAIFALAGIGKLLDLEGSEKTVKDFGVPNDLAKFFAVGLPVAEIIIAVLLLPTSTAWFGAIGAFLLLLAFIGGMLWQLAQGNAPDCHCFGQIHSEPVSVKSLLRNAIFAILSFFLILQGQENQGLSLLNSTDNSTEGNAMSLILGLATVGLLAAAVYFLKIISDRQTQIMRRIEILELTTLEGGSGVKREDVSQPEEGLLIGTPAPDFELPDINGKQISFEQLLAQKKPLLLFFISPNCNPCAALLPEIETWQNELKDKLSFIFISSGKVKENLDKFAGKLLKQILLQKDKEVAELFAAQWTPTVLLINSDGNIASRLAVGDKAVRQLVENIKAEIDHSKPLLIAPTNGNGLEKSKLGETLPEFSLLDVSNKTISSKDLRGRKTLIAFWSTTCGYCREMLEDLRDWDKTKGADEPDLLLLSEGEAEQHQTLDLQSPILLDKEREISNEIGMEGTPSAILVNEEGKIISETAVGAEQIWILLGKRK
ncbi:MAG: redoxin domain-containing protein [Pyrinomonadaceae bacterium]